MSERFHGDFDTGYSRFAELPEGLAEAREIMISVDRLLARLIEQGGDLPGDSKKALRAAIQAHMARLGATSWQEYFQLTDRLYQAINDRIRNPIAPNYPSRAEFADRYRQVIRERPSTPGHRPGLYPEASDVATHGQYDWAEIDGRSDIPIVDYIYNIGRVMSDRISYGQVFDRDDAITVDDTWHIENGRHRALALRVLEEPYILQTGMDRWVIVARENQ